VKPETKKPTQKIKVISCPKKPESAPKTIPATEERQPDLKRATISEQGQGIAFTHISTMVESLDEKVVLAKDCVAIDAIKQVQHPK
jgi:hypothetical protein